MIRDIALVVVIGAAVGIALLLLGQVAKWTGRRMQPVVDEGAIPQARSTAEFMATVTGDHRTLMEIKEEPVIPLPGPPPIPDEVGYHEPGVDPSGPEPLPRREGVDEMAPFDGGGEFALAPVQTSIYLEAHPPARRQFWTSRRKAVTAIVLHTAENEADTTGEDSGAEGVAGYISRRTDAAGAYASLVDSDSIVRLGRYEWTMFHCRNFNSPSLGLAWALRKQDWPKLTEELLEAFLSNAAKEAASMCSWVLANEGYVIPARLISRQQALDGMRGFVYHSQMDPGRRSDPGITQSMQDRFFKLYEYECALLDIDLTTGGNVIVTPLESITKDLQKALVSRNINIGTSGPDGNGVDGDPREKTIGGALVLIEKQENARDDLVAEIDELNRRLTEKEIEIGRLRSGGEGGVVGVSEIDQMKIDYVDALVLTKRLRSQLEESF